MAEEPDKIEIQTQVYPSGYPIPDDMISRWIEIPADEQVYFGPLPRSAIDDLLFSTRDIVRSIAQLRLAVIFLAQGKTAPLRYRPSLLPGPKTICSFFRYGLLTA